MISSKFKLAADLLFQVKLFHRQLVLERINFPERQGVFECDSHLRGHLLEQLDIGGSECV